MRRFLTIGFVAGLLAFPAFTLAGQTVRIQIDTSRELGNIADDFLGFGYETSAVAQAGFFTADNARMIRLYRNLGPNGLIRIGGNVSDHTRFIPDGIAAVKTEREVTIINRQNLTDLAAFARATGWRVMWGLNLGMGTKEQAAAEAVAVDQALGPSLHSFQIGNEVDLPRKFGRNFDAYHAAYLDYKAAIRAKLPHAVFSGPDVAGSFIYVQKFVAAESADMALVTHHYYRGGAHDPKSTLQRLLQRDTAFDSRLDQLQSLCSAHRLSYRINEVNSYYGGGKQGVSDTFGSALWCLDYLFDLASHRCAGVNLETDINQLGFISFYSPIVHDASGVCSARPEYYAMLVFATAGRGHLLSTHVESSGLNLSAYATKVSNDEIDLTVINKDLADDAELVCTAPDGMHAAKAFGLIAPSIDARSGVSFAGASVDDEGNWTAGSGKSLSLTGGLLKLPVQRASAVVIKFNAI